MMESEWRKQRSRWAARWSRLAWRLAERCTNATFVGDEEYARKMARRYRAARDREDEARFDGDSELAELPADVIPEEGFR